jgi:hypothetical protein
VAFSYLFEKFCPCAAYVNAHRSQNAVLVRHRDQPSDPHRGGQDNESRGPMARSSSPYKAFPKMAMKGTKIKIVSITSYLGKYVVHLRG